MHQLTRFISWEVSINCEGTLNRSIGHDLCHDTLHTTDAIGLRSKMLVLCIGLAVSSYALLGALRGTTVAGTVLVNRSRLVVVTVREGVWLASLFATILPASDQTIFHPVRPARGRSAIILLC